MQLGAEWEPAPRARPAREAQPARPIQPIESINLTERKQRVGRAGQKEAAPMPVRVERAESNDDNLPPPPPSELNDTMPTVAQLLLVQPNNVVYNDKPPQYED